MKLPYLCDTRIGEFYIGYQYRRFHPVHDGDSLGSYAHAWQAAEDLAGGHAFSIASGIDTSTLGIPHELGDWQRLTQAP